MYKDISGAPVKATRVEVSMSLLLSSIVDAVIVTMPSNGRGFTAVKVTVAIPEDDLFLKVKAFFSLEPTYIKKN